MQATKKEYYWAEYIRNKKSVWIVKNTESLVLKKYILNKLSVLKADWTIISNVSALVELKSSDKIHKNYFCTPEAQDIIPFVLLEKKEQYSFFYTDNHINYLHSI